HHIAVARRADDTLGGLYDELAVVVSAGRDHDGPRPQFQQAHAGGEGQVHLAARVEQQFAAVGQFVTAPLGSARGRIGGQAAQRVVEIANIGGRGAARRQQRRARQEAAARGGNRGGMRGGFLSGRGSEFISFRVRITQASESAATQRDG